MLPNTAVETSNVTLQKFSFNLQPALHLQLQTREMNIRTAGYSENWYVCRRCTTTAVDFVLLLCLVTPAVHTVTAGVLTTDQLQTVLCVATITPTDISHKEECLLSHWQAQVTHLFSINPISEWCMWRTEKHIGFWWGQLIDRDQLEDMGMRAKKLKWNLEQRSRKGKGKVIPFQAWCGPECG